jgi:MoaA/NifB/PqqE/SkfB family radical SAM enzyme
MREIVADLCRMKVRAVTFSGGGEPLCCPYIAQTAESLADGGVKLALLTNGSLLTGAAADVFARRATWVRVSMDAVDGPSYARNRHVRPSEFGRVCRNIREFARRPDRRSVIGLNLIVTAENCAGVYDFLAMARGLGVGHVKVSEVVVGVSTSENASYLQPFFESVKRQIARAQARLTGNGFEVIDKFYWPGAEQEAYLRENHRCPFAQCLTVIAADQNVYTCQDKAYTKSGLIGSIRNRSFAELWSSARTSRRLCELDPSRDCRHHCVAHAKNLMLLNYLAADREHLDFV